ncbi:hypothetical protein ILYODFUR_009275 [Ilyodon furcidens]|uniref:Uncharacterized protein n=1 Tax=Ilyodon furcidens TaxID=33524 RepID=A0ABV0SZ55_9TELE
MFGLWEETGLPGQNPRMHGENMQTPCRKTLGQESNPGPSCCKATVLPPVPPCSPLKQCIEKKPTTVASAANHHKVAGPAVSLSFPHTASHFFLLPADPLHSLRPVYVGGMAQ